MTGESRKAVRSARRPLQLEICAWQRAAALLLAVSIASNAALYGLLNQQEVRHAREVDELRRELRTAERIRDHAVRELGVLQATGLPAGPGIVAVDPEIIPLGSTVLIDGRQYLAADTGALVQGLHVDICMETHAMAEEFGVQTEEVWVRNG